MSDQLEREIRRQTKALFEQLSPIDDLLPAEMAHEAGIDQSLGTTTLKPPGARKRVRGWLVVAAVSGALLFISLPAAIWLTGPAQEAGPPAPGAPLEPQRQGMVQNPANGHFYEVASLSGSLTQANTQAIARSFRETPGHIVTITSKQEDNFVREAFKEVFDSGPGGPYLGGFQHDGSVEPGGGWQWVTGEPFEFTDWIAGEPNDSFDEDCIEHIEWPEAGWNDIPCPESGEALYIVEYDVEQ